MVQPIVLVGLKNAGKSSVGHALAGLLACSFIDTDTAIEALYEKQQGEALRVPAIYQRIGEQQFQALEAQVFTELMVFNQPVVIATGGGSLFNKTHILFKKSRVVYLQASIPTLLKRWRQRPPTFIDPHKIEQELQQYYEKRAPVYYDLAEMIVTVDDKSIHSLAEEIEQLL